MNRSERLSLLGLFACLDAFLGHGCAVHEPVGLVARLDDVAVVRESIQQCRGHLGVAEHAGPFLEVQVEVDFVLESPLRKIIGIEVKAAASVEAKDFKGLRKLQHQTGTDFLTGIVLYDGDKALSFGEGLWAVPLAAL